MASLVCNQPNRNPCVPNQQHSPRERTAPLSLDIWNARQLGRPLIHHRLVHWLKTVVWILLAVPLRDIRSRVSCIWPMRCANPALVGVFLPDEIFLSRVAHGHVASVDCESGLRGLRAEIVVGRTRVPRLLSVELRSYGRVLEH
jgi:hypothetical protein